MANNLEECESDQTIGTGSGKNYDFGIYTIKKLCYLLKIIFSKRVCVTFVFLICFMSLLEQYLAYHIGIVPSGFYKTLGNKNWHGFWLQVLKASLLILAMCFVLSCKKYINKVFYVSSREILTERLQILYFNDSRFYFLNNLRYADTDNPDQRITQDVDKFCSQFSSVINPFIIAPFTISYYSYNCYQRNGWIGPISVFVLFLLSAAINKLLMKPVMNKIMKQEKYEGFFRFKHMHIRTNAESIAFQDANLAELNRTDAKLFKLIKTQQSLYLREFPLEVLVNVFSYFGSIVSYLILAYPVFSGKYDDMSPADLSALISQNAFVTIYLMSCFSSLINISTTLSEIGGLTHRVCDLLDLLNTNMKPKNESYSNKNNYQLKLDHFSGDMEVVIELHKVTICPPKDNKPLVSDLDLQLTIGSNLLITGKSSSGKTSLFRVIKGLWNVHSGSISRRLPFHPSVMFFLPQHSLLSDGTLLEQIIYPLELPRCIQLKDIETDYIISYLKFVDLEHILKKAGLHSKVEWNWNDILSPGEAQRLSFVRLFYHKPKVAFLDEATSAIGIELEEKIYTKCQELGITVVSIGHRTSLLKYHDCVLHLDGEGGWTLTSLRML